MIFLVLHSAAEMGAEPRSVSPTALATNPPGGNCTKDKQKKISRLNHKTLILKPWAKRKTNV